MAQLDAIALADLGGGPRRGALPAHSSRMKAIPASTRQPNGTLPEVAATLGLVALDVANAVALGFAEICPTGRPLSAYGAVSETAPS